MSLASLSPIILARSLPRRENLLPPLPGAPIDTSHSSNRSFSAGAERFHLAERQAFEMFPAPPLAEDSHHVFAVGLADLLADTATMRAFLHLGFLLFPQGREPPGAVEILWQPQPHAGPGPSKRDPGDSFDHAALAMAILSLSPAAAQRGQIGETIGGCSGFAHGKAIMTSAGGSPRANS
jgi:hypothetical protein